MVATILVNRKWHSERVLLEDLTEQQRWALKVHLTSLTEGAPVLEELGFIRRGETEFFRGQPETQFERNQIGCRLVGFSHWQIQNGMTLERGARSAATLRKALKRVLPSD
jgi:hypothetical protein